jgi:hypothetical protein
MWHKRMLTVVLLIIFIAGLGSLEINSVSAAAPTAPVALSPQGDIFLCNNVLNQIKFEFSAVTGATGYTIQLSTVPDFSGGRISFFYSLSLFTRFSKFKSWNLLLESTSL